MLEGLIELFVKERFDLLYCFSYLSAPTKMLTELVADQVAPSYWIPNKDVHVRKRFLLFEIIRIIIYILKKCSSCDLEFGLEYSKHHCRGLFARKFITLFKTTSVQVYHKE
jgi:hypothetical protein